jgi:hypothetical protein
MNQGLFSYQYPVRAELPGQPQLTLCRMAQ